ncbi:kinase-regulated stress-responsive transcription factor skn7 [Scheffersomyces spartinae]|uniref:Transcription factor n=1 Tax=Scheffersomyces spartinae TaxID=45513 RepID=A0A9P7VD85_9ASCO|nr:kinase-regulated stress-responsive transcription factor skn7 [Scheffersomyces spartinae]KAG7195970.1 kinase-regulated stress-responsive transcription factor skn7 [Scheffersomyces spartinae]
MTESTGGSSGGNSSNDFVKKLYQMLQIDEYQNVVRWTVGGDSFVVMDTNEFTKTLLPRHFKHSNFASFVRQLNKYDFHKVKKPLDERNLEYGDDAWEFKHPDFRRDDLESLDNIKRKGPSVKKSNPNSAIDATMVSNQYTAQLSLLKDQLESLKSENIEIRKELNVLSNKYNALVENIVGLKSFTERYHHSLNVLVNCLVQAGIKLPPLDFANPNLITMTQPPRPPVVDTTIKSTLVNPSPIDLPLEQQQLQQTSVLPLGGGGGSGYHPIPPQSQQQQQQQQPIRMNPQMLGPQEPTAQQQPSPVSLPLGVGAGVGVGVGAPLQNLQHFTPNSSIKPEFHVLLVEDDNVCIQLCRKFLLKYGCEVTVVTDGLIAIATVEKKKYDLVLMDIVMPNLDGATATSVIRSFDTKTPIIAMTGNLDDSDLVTYLQNGMSDILAKPFTKDDLYNMLTKHLLPSASTSSSSQQQQQQQPPAQVKESQQPPESLPPVGVDVVSIVDPTPPGMSMSQQQSAPNQNIVYSDEPLLKKQRI